MITMIVVIVIVSTIIVMLSGSSCARYMQGKSCLCRPVCSEYPYKCYNYDCCMMCLHPVRATALSVLLYRDNTLFHPAS